MAKFADVIGFADSSETTPGVWTDVITERKYFGDIRRNARQLEEKEMKVNDDISISNTIEIVRDAYALENFLAIRYVKWNGGYWKVSNVEVKPDAPRLALRLGGVYNGPKASAP